MKQLKKLFGGIEMTWRRVIIANCKSAKEAAAKTFVFFLISQPLIYLFQVPFSEKGWLAPVILSAMTCLPAAFWYWLHLPRYCGNITTITTRR